ncbi:unnamed protein product [Bemisia tabaci]|uniref:Beta-lactamase-like protein 2 homolog n=1 Tax=Bemisia tabaci TaxID=7038 RepID=A0A9P0A1K5_BEMTA|nr:unnamed protein product [Bemisia tabaci]
MSTFIAPISRLSNSVIRILGCNAGPMTLQGTNTYLLGTGKSRILLDTGEPNIPEYIDILENLLQNEGATLSDIIVSHWHNDHIGGVKDVLKLTQSNSTVWKYPRASDEMEDLPKEVNFQQLKNRQKFVTEGISLEVIHTPGHTSDHIILWAPENKIVFSADCILGEGTAVFEDLLSYLNSLRLIQTLSAKVIYPGHGPEVTDPEEKIKYYIEHRLKRENQIIETLKSSPNTLFTPLTIVQLLYENLDDGLQQFAAHNIRQHLVKLLKEGKVFEDDDKWQLKNNKL